MVVLLVCEKKYHRENLTVFHSNVACEQALYLGLTRDLFWARAASGRERIGAGASLGELAAITEEFLRPIYTIRLCRMRQVYDRPTSGVVSCKSNLQLAYGCCVRQKNCRRILKHVLKRCDNRSRN